MQSKAMALDIQVQITPCFVAHLSTIWPAVNQVAAEVDELIAADEALMALLKKKPGSTP